MSEQLAQVSLGDTRAAWAKVLRRAVDADTWGQALEALDDYAALAAMIERQLPGLELDVDARSTITKVRLSLTLRIQALKDPSGRGLGLDQVKKLVGVLDTLFTDRQSALFPIPLDQYADSLSEGDLKPTGARDVVVVAADEKKKDNGGNHAAAAAGGLLPPVHVAHSGVTTLSIVVDKVGLKDAQSYIDARVTVSVVDGHGQICGPQQTTPFSNSRKPNYVLFGHTVHIQTTWQEINPSWAIFLEFQHYKPKKKKVSTRCFTFMEYDELKDGGERVLELYKKPTDWRRRRLNLFSVKKLYMHVTINFHKH